MEWIIASAIYVLSILSGAVWVGSQKTRIDNLEKKVDRIDPDMTEIKGKLAEIEAIVLSIKERLDRG